MASNFQEFITKVTLNAEEAQKQLNILSARATEYRKLRDAAAKAGDKNAMEKYAKEVNISANLRGKEKELRHTSPIHKEKPPPPRGEDGRGLIGFNDIDATRTG